MGDLNIVVFNGFTSDEQISAYVLFEEYKKQRQKAVNLRERVLKDINDGKGIPKDNTPNYSESRNFELDFGNDELNQGLFLRAGTAKDQTEVRYIDVLSAETEKSKAGSSHHVMLGFGNPEYTLARMDFLNNHSLLYGPSVRDVFSEPGENTEQTARCCLSSVQGIDDGGYPKQIAGFVRSGSRWQRCEIIIRDGMVKDIELGDELFIGKTTDFTRIASSIAENHPNKGKPIEGLEK